MFNQDIEITHFLLNTKKIKEVMVIITILAPWLKTSMSLTQRSIVIDSCLNKCNLSTAFSFRQWERSGLHENVYNTKKPVVYFHIRWTLVLAICVPV